MDIPKPWALTCSVDGLSRVRACRRTSEGSPARRPQGERGGAPSRPLSAVPLRDSLEHFPSRLLSTPAMQVTLMASFLMGKTDFWTCLNSAVPITA